MGKSGIYSGMKKNSQPSHWPTTLTVPIYYYYFNLEELLPSVAIQNYNWTSFLPTSATIFAYKSIVTENINLIQFCTKVDAEFAAIIVSKTLIINFEFFKRSYLTM